MTIAGDNTPMTMDPSVHCETCGGWYRVADNGYTSVDAPVDDNHLDGKVYTCNSCANAKAPA
jgi:hypothetical protein